MAAFNPSPEQEAIKKGFCETDNNLMIQAGPGTGKSRTLEYLAPFAPRGSIYLAFNKRIVEELVPKLPPNMQGKTFHSLMYSFLKERMRKKLTVNGYKAANWVRDKYGDTGLADLSLEFNDLVSKGKNLGVMILENNDRDFWASVADNYDIQFLDEDGEDWTETAIKAAIKFVKEPYRQGRPLPDEIDFDDMLHMSAYFADKHGWPWPHFPTVFIDEYQDTNGLQQFILGNIADRVVAVGDQYQAIYGFRAATVNAMDEGKKAFGCLEFPLQTTFRCPKSHVENVWHINPNLKAADGAKEGRIEELGISEMIEILSSDDLVVCRNNFPLFSVAVQLLKGRRPFQIGDKFVKQLMRFVSRFKGSTMREFREQLTEWWGAEKAKLEAQGKFGRLQREEDKVNALLELQKDCRDWDHLITTLERLTRSKDGTKLFTIHGAKGLEAERVFFLQPDLIPSKYAVSEEALRQETNLEFVALTRSKNELYFVA